MADPSLQPLVQAFEQTLAPSPVRGAGDRGSNATDQGPPLQLSAAALLIADCLLAPAGGH